MRYINLPDNHSVSIWDRCTSAYYAFRMQTRPDVQRVLDEIEKMQKASEQKEEKLDDKRVAAMEKLDPFTRAQIHSIASATENWRKLYDESMLFVSGLPVEDQLVIMRYIFSGNRNIVTTTRFRQWMTNHADTILDYLPE